MKTFIAILVAAASITTARAQYVVTNPISDVLNEVMHVEDLQFSKVCDHRDHAVIRRGVLVRTSRTGLCLAAPDNPAIICWHLYIKCYTIIFSRSNENGSNRTT
jgi:hypothetical protein